MESRVPIPGSLTTELRRRPILLALGGAAVVALAVSVWIARESFESSLATLATVEPATAAWAASAFAGSLLATACAWQVAFAAIGSPVGRAGACANFSVGSLVNTFVPGGVGEGVRAVLFGRTLPEERDRCRAFATAGAVGAVAMAKALSHVVVLSCAVLLVGFPRWLVAAPAVLVLVGAGTVFLLRNRIGDARLSAVARAAATLVRRPAVGLQVIGWTAIATAGRIAAATAVAASFGIADPLRAGLVVTAALVVSAALPITPGSIGITSGAVSLVLAQQGVPVPTALAAGMLFHALEAAVSVSFGLIATPFVLRPGVLRPRGVHVALAGATLVAAAALGAALVTDLPLTGV
jgi:uncharacterized membrane protein YbhN (UPF0104 family)